MLSLVHNEHEKMYSKKSIWICYILLFALLVAIGIIPILIEGRDASTMYKYMQDTSSLVGFILMMIVVIGATNISSEYSSGTVKLLLIRPNKRWKVLTSKFIATFVFTFEILFFLFISSLILGFLFYGKDGNKIVEVFTMEGMKEVNVWSNLFNSYLYGFVQLIVLVFFGLMLSSLFRSNAAAIGMTVFLFFTGNMISGILFSLEQEWGKYFLFSNIDLSVYKYSDGMFEGMSLEFSIAVLAVHIILFTIVSWWAFCKRDVTF